VKAGSKLPLRVTANTGNVSPARPEAAIPRAVVKAFGLQLRRLRRTFGHAGVHLCERRARPAWRQDSIDRGWRSDLRSVATTIVDLSGGGNSWMILREGAIPTHEIALLLQR